MRFILDMNLSPRTAAFLTTNGYDVKRINEIFTLKGIQDEEIIDYAANNDYYIITSDYDFGEILAILKTNKPSTIILKLKIRSVDNVNKRLLNVLPLIAEELEKGSIVVVEDQRVRSRTLPL